MPKSQLLLGLALLGLWEVCGCGPQEEVVARVGEKAITAGDLRRFQAETPELFRSPKEGAEAARDYLQTLIDMELMLRQARARRLDQDPEFLYRWEEERRKKLVAEFQRQKIWEQLQLSEEEIQERFDQSKWSRVLKLARIAVATEAEAAQVVRLLEAGEPFAEVARERSLDQQTAAAGGLLEPLYGRANMQELGVTPAIGEELFSLEIGEHSRPFRIGSYYQIFALVEKPPAPPHYREVFAREMLKSEFYERRQDLVKNLVDEFGVELDSDGLSLLRARAAAADAPLPRLSSQERQMPLCRFAGGHLGLGEFLDAYQQVWFFNPVVLDSSGIARFLHQHLLPDLLLYRVALREGLEKDPSVAAWLAAKEEELLLELLRQREVEQRVAVTPEAVRGYYQAHPQRFTRPGEVWVSEILVASLEEAQALLQRLDNGEDMGELARRHSIRPKAAENSGRLHLHFYERAVFGALLDTALAAAVGELRGPVQVKEGYSVFKVEEKIPPRLQPFDQVAPRAIYWFKKQEEERLFKELLSRLREQYAGEVVLFEDRLQSMEW